MQAPEKPLTINPYETPQENIAETTRPKVAKVSILWTLSLSIILPICVTPTLLVAGYFLGGWIYDNDPNYWNQHHSYEHLAKIDTRKVGWALAGNFATNLGGLGFLGGLLLPWFRFAWATIKRWNRLQSLKASRGLRASSNDPHAQPRISKSAPP